MQITQHQLNVDDNGALLVTVVDGDTGQGSDPAPSPTVNPDGSINVNDLDPTYPLVTGTVLALNDVVVVDCRKAKSLSLGLKNSGTAAQAAGTIVFEASINSTNGTDGDWFSVAMTRVDNVGPTGSVSPTLPAGGAAGYAYKLSAAPFNWFRARVSTALTANAAALLTVLRSSQEVDGTVGVGAHPVTGSGNFNVVPTVGTALALVTAASTNLAAPVTVATSLYELTAFNPTAAVAYLKLYNKPTAPVLASDVPLAIIPIPAGGEVTKSYGFTGKRFSSGLAWAVTGAPAVTDATAVGAGIIISGTRY